MITTTHSHKAWTDKGGHVKAVLALRQEVHLAETMQDPPEYHL